MSSGPESRGSTSPRADQEWVYVIRIDMKDGTVLHPVSISKAEQDWSGQLDDAVEYFSQAYKDHGIVSIEYAENIYFAGVVDTENIRDWKTFRSIVLGLSGS